MPADLAHRFLANLTLLNAKKRAPISNVLGGSERGHSTRILLFSFGGRLRGRYVALKLFSVQTASGLGSQYTS